MSSHCEGGQTPCEACLDWRIGEANSMGSHVANLVRAVVADLGIDIDDEDVRAIVVNRMREYGAGIEPP